MLIHARADAFIITATIATVAAVGTALASAAAVIGSVAATVGAFLGTTAFTIGTFAVTWGAALKFTILAVLVTMSIVMSARNSDRLKAPASKYTAPIIQNTWSNEYVVPICYGDGDGDGFYVGGNILWQSDPASTIHRFIGISVGECDSVTEVLLDEQDIDTISGCSYTFYSGTSTQIPNVRCKGVVKGLHDLCYCALTITSGEKVSSNPLIAFKIKGKKIKTWDSATSSWDTNAEAVSNNPAAIIRDYLLLSRVLGGCGLVEADIDNTSFGLVSEYCDELVDNGEGSTEPRYEMSLTLDTRHTAIDNITKLIINANVGIIRSDGKYKLIIDRHDLSRSLSFTEDNIVKGTFQYGYGKGEEMPTRVIVEWWNPEVTRNGKRAAICDDELSEEIFGRRETRLECFGVNRQSQALRMAKQVMYDSKVNDIWCAFESSIEALAIEIGDYVEVTHSLPNWTAAKFTITGITEIDYGRCAYTLRAYNPSILDDRQATTIDDWDYGSPPNPYTPVTDVESVILEEKGWRNIDGTHITHIEVTWESPTTKYEYLNTYVIQLAEYDDDTAEWNDYITVGSANKGETTYRIITNLEIGKTYKVKVKTQSTENIFSDGTESNTLLLIGKDDPPSDVGTFAVRKYRDYIIARWIPVSDVDVNKYEIRAGASWASGEIIAENATGREITIRDIKTGTDQSYWIKAIDNSGNYSDNATEATISIYGIPFQNIIISTNEHTNWLDNSNIYYVSNDDTQDDLRKATDSKDLLAQSFTVGDAAITVQACTLKLKRIGTI